MQAKRLVVGALLVAMAVLETGVVSGQNYPTKPVRIVTGGVGGGNDFTSRLIALGISSPLGQPVIVENRASGVIAIDAVAKAQPDGHTLLNYGGGVWITPLFGKVSWDPVRDFSPIVLVSTEPSLLVVHTSVAVNSTKELIALAKARPGELNFVSGARGGTGHFAGELFKSMAGVNIVFIPYKSGGLAVNDLLAGQVQMGFISTSTIAPHIKLGRLRALAVTSLQPSALAPGLPTVGTSVPGYPEMGGTTGIYAPAKTPQAIINRLNQEIGRLLNQADTKEKLFNAGQEIAGGPPENLAARMKSEMATLGKLISEAGIRAE